MQNMMQTALVAHTIKWRNVTQRNRSGSRAGGGDAKLAAFSSLKASTSSLHPRSDIPVPLILLLKPRKLPEHGR